MQVLACVASIRTKPLETIELLLNCFDEWSASDDGVRSFARFGPRIWVEIDFHLTIVFKRQVVTVFAFFSFFANTSLEVAAKRGFFVNYKGERLDQNVKIIDYLLSPSALV